MNTAKVQKYIKPVRDYCKKENRRMRWIFCRFAVGFR